MIDRIPSFPLCSKKTSKTVQISSLYNFITLSLLFSTFYTQKKSLIFIGWKKIFLVHSFTGCVSIIALLFTYKYIYIYIIFTYKYINKER